MNSTTSLNVVGVCGTGLPSNNKHEIKPREVRQSIQVIDNGRTVRLNSGVDLDLTSSERNITLGANLFATTDSVEIASGGLSKTVTAGSQVSAAEYLAVKQVLSGSGQKVSIDKAGRATGGEIDFGSITCDNVLRATNFVNAENVTTYGDFGRHSEFRLNGDLTNYGTVNALSSDANIRQGVIHADGITNHEGGSINSSVDLTLDAAGILSNQGSINSTGTLTLTAGSSIENSGSIKASSHVALNAFNVNNQGSITSDHGDISLNGSADVVLAVNNIGGTLSAVNGAINLRDRVYNGTFGSSIYGGDLFSNELNLNSGQGLTTIDVGQLTGLVNQSGTAAHVKAETDELNIGQVCLVGDPTFYNTAGDINLNADFTVGERLTIVASGSIIGAQDIDIIAGDANRGYDITLIAGAAFTATGGNNSPTVPPLTGSGSVTLSGKASKTGGSINFGTNTRLAARSTDGSGNDNGANVSLFAFAGKNAASGQVSIGQCTVVTGGKNAGDNGEIFIAAGAVGKSDPVNGVITGVLDTTGGSGANGDLVIITAQPVASNGPVTYDATGARTSESQLAVQQGKFSKGSSILVAAVAGGREHDISGNSFIGTGGEIYVQGDVRVQGTVDWLGTTAITDGSAPLPIESATSIVLRSEGNIGVEGDPLTLKTPDFRAITSGDFLAIDLSGTGTTNIGSTSGGGLVSIEYSTGTLSSDSGIKAPTVLLAALDYGTINSIVASTEVGITKLGPTVLNSANFAFIQTPKLSVVTNTADVGSVANHFAIPNSVNIFNAVSTTGNVFVSSNSGEDIEVGAISGASIDLDTAAGLTITNGVIASTGAVDIQTGGGTLSIIGDVGAKTNLTISNNGVEKSKLAIAKNATLITNALTAGQGNITISLGAPGAVTGTQPVHTVINNVGGTISFTGSQKAVDGGVLKAKSPDNNISLSSTTILINNGTEKAGNFTLGGNVSIISQ